MVKYSKAEQNSLERVTTFKHFELVAKRRISFVLSDLFLTLKLSKLGLHTRT